MNKIILTLAILCGCILQGNTQTRDLMYANNVRLILENHEIQPHITNCKTVINTLNGRKTTKKPYERTGKDLYLFTYQGVDLVLDSCYRVSGWYIEKGSANASFKYNSLEFSLGCSYQIVETAFDNNFSTYMTTINNNGTRVIYSNIYDDETKQAYDTVVCFEFDFQDKLIKISYRTPM